MNKTNKTRSKILNHMLNQGNTSKVELSKELNLSMPTVLSNVNDLIQKDVIVEVGEYESTGGRKARSLGINKDYRYSIGVNITANHISFVLINMAGEVIKHERSRVKFAPEVTYYSRLSEMLSRFIADEMDPSVILGVGISLPGIIHKEEKILVRSHALQLENYSLKMMEQLLPFPVSFENDANAAMQAENPQVLGNAIYLSLNNTLGGALCMNGQLSYGQNQKAGEFGHMILVPGGKTCYCGKQGCADAYCAASVLTRNGEITLDAFMERLEQNDPSSLEIWDQYLDHLAILISNLRMAYDTDIILGGEAGGYLSDYLVELGKRIFRYNLFDQDISYLKTCSYRKEASAVGAAKHFIQNFIEQI